MTTTCRMGPEAAVAPGGPAAPASAATTTAPAAQRPRYLRIKQTPLIIRREPRQDIPCRQFAGTRRDGSRTPRTSRATGQSEADGGRAGLNRRRVAYLRVSWPSSHTRRLAIQQ